MLVKEFTALDTPTLIVDVNFIGLAFRMSSINVMITAVDLMITWWLL